MASSHTLLIYIYTSNIDITNAELNTLMEDVKLISYPKHIPKLLLIIGSDERTLMIRRQLKYLWDKKFFNVVILEVFFRSKYSEPVFVALHSFNGFHDDYSRLTEHADIIDWYPSKSRNMHGNKFKITFEDTRTYGSLNSKGDADGLAKTFADTLSIAMNATVVHTPFRRENDLTYNALALVYTDLYSANYEHTIAIDNDRICLLTPILTSNGLYFDFWQIFIMVMIGLLLAAIVWCASVVLKVSKQVRDPLNTISLFFNISPLSKPRSLVEKVLFIGVMITAAEYTTLFQGELFEFAIEYTRNRHVSTFEDLYDTEMRVLVSPLIYRQLKAFEELPPGLIKKFKPVYSFANNQGKLDTSVALLLSEIDGKLLEITYTNNEGKRFFILSDLCILSHYRAHSLPVKSPFKDDVNRVLLSLTEYGFVKKHLEEFWNARRRIAIDTKEKRELIPNDMSAYVAIGLILIGHGISLLVFVGELLIDEIAKHKFVMNAKRLCCKLMKIPK